MSNQPAEWLLLATLMCLSMETMAQSVPPETDAQLVAYDASFFDRYQPNTALDMVRQLPGFSLDDGDSRRGFGGSVGNLLINDRYPSAKQDKPSTILARIAASRVIRVELIRGQVRKIDLRGNPVVVNLVLADDGVGAVRWQLAVRKNLDIASLTPSGSISISDRWGSTDYIVGFDTRKSGYGDPGSERELNGAGDLTELRTIRDRGRGHSTNAFFSASRPFGETLVQLNSTVGVEVREEDRQVRNMPVADGALPDNELFLNDRDNLDIEIGLDIKRGLTPALTGKGILLFHRQDQAPFSSQRNFDASGNQTLFRQADTDRVSDESIARLELDWTGIANHTIKIGAEGARNTLDSQFVQIIDSGSGPEVVPVPGSNTRVEEVRGEIQIIDTVAFDNAELSFGASAESSTITQSGDANVKRSFFYLKPEATLTYAASAEKQTRIHVGREVSQLDFDDFVSATIFEDNDVVLGNPDLRPETTWVLEVSQERRFGDLGVGKMTAFHHWISDVEDLLPLGPDVEAPGNIGEGRRWGVVLEATLPLDAVGLSNSRLNVKARWQDSSVTDPVTFENRVLSAKSGYKGDLDFEGENRYAVHLDFRQDLNAGQVAWGWNSAVRAERPLFKVNEYDVHDEGTELNFFIETTRWFGVKVKLSATNVFNYRQTRDRTAYVAERELSSVEFREQRTLTNGARVELSVDGAF